MKIRGPMSMPLIIWILVGFVIFSKSYAENQTQGNAPCRKIQDQGPSPQIALPLKEWSKTEHMLRIEGSELPYSANTGVLPVHVDPEGPECRIYFINYDLEGREKTSRPLSFVFNGGPGASSVYLHLAALGPKRITYDHSENVSPRPGRLVDNVQTWLRFTDLVFIDPVGTGFSRCVSSTSDPDKKNAETHAWGVREDLTSLSKFIRLYLTRTNRWLSPKFIVGESYGGFRVAALSDLLQSDYGITLNGVVLVSPALEFNLLKRDEYSLMPWLVTIPSYAAAARFHGMAEGGISGTEDPRTGLQEIERFTVKELLPALAMGDTETLNSRLSLYIGLSADRVAQWKAKIPPVLFVKALLQDSGRLISLYDGSFTAIDPDPSSPFPSTEDPLLIRLNALLTAGLNSLVREQLKFETDIPYEVLNKEVSKKWNWRSGLEWDQGFVGVAGNLKTSMSINKDLKAFIVHGVFDFVTPYFGSVVITRQMALDPVIASNLKLKVYEGGHMFYTDAASRKAFFEDARRFFKSAVPD